MRLILVVVLMSLFVRESQCQIALLDKVYDFIEAKDFSRAEAAVLQAEKHVTTANDARTYYLKSYVYKEMFSADTGAARDDLRLKAYQSLKRCESLDVDNSFNTVVKQLTDYIIASTFNDASDAFNNQNFNRAISGFSQYLAYSPINDEYWLDANYFLASSFNSLGQIDSAVRYYDQLRTRNYDQPLVFVDLAYIYLKQQNHPAARQVVKEAAILFPNHYDILVAELNVLSASQEFSILETKAEKFLKTYPADIEVMLLLANTYLKNAAPESHYEAFRKAVDIYQKVLEMEPLNYDGNYNLGVLYYNEAVDIVNKNDFDTDIDQLAVILEKSTTFFQNALPLLLKIYSIRQDDRKLLTALQAIYYNLNMKGELAEINDHIKLLGTR
jgi:tetratricopeptide (TPR) repeat protein